MTAITTTLDLFSRQAPTAITIPALPRYMAWIVPGDDDDTAHTLVVDGLKMEVMP